MFKLLLATPHTGAHHNLANQGIMIPRQAPMLLAATLTAILFLSGCQQQAADETVPDNAQNSEKTSEQMRAEDSQPMPKSDSAAARIEQFQPLYVTQFQGLQQRLQAEYESLQAADASGNGSSLLVDSATDSADSNTKNNNEQTTDSNSLPAAGANNSTALEPAALDSADPVSIADIDNKPATDTEINTSTEVGERDLTVLKRISLEPRKPVLLTEEQIIERYEQAMEALYQPVTTPLSAEDVDTLIDIATLVPQLFEDAEIAGRVSAKSPALARLIIQHQVWEQIEAQQVLDMQQMKLNQQKEFEMLMSKFNETIKGYDEQIAKYEQTLKEFK
ncbi:hypothetical protein [Psychrobacter sp. DAB_AL32B]|uniref:hypothetical protein n=1 Tax=Psychrobacter sp. DAB_AL32B TaxID=1028414 RepID=UPI000B7DB485|nr:hypothetical protein [Psychrobacter sp. DAB_AL32B]OXL19603.1 hypothetical protein CAN34_11235 [Psychrobacter sp. DAB_AL32B]